VLSKPVGRPDRQSQRHGGSNISVPAHSCGPCGAPHRGGQGDTSLRGCAAWPIRRAVRALRGPPGHGRRSGRGRQWPPSSLRELCGHRVGSYCGACGRGQRRHAGVAVRRQALLQRAADCSIHANGQGVDGHGSQVVTLPPIHGLNVRPAAEPITACSRTTAAVRRPLRAFGEQQSGGACQRPAHSVRGS